VTTGTVGAATVTIWTFALVVRTPDSVNIEVAITVVTTLEVFPVVVLDVEEGVDDGSACLISVDRVTFVFVSLLPLFIVGFSMYVKLLGVDGSSSTEIDEGCGRAVVEVVLVAVVLDDDEEEEEEEEEGDERVEDTAQGPSTVSNTVTSTVVAG
jgi:hypothetical protein